MRTFAIATFAAMTAAVDLDSPLTGTLYTGHPEDHFDCVCDWDDIDTQLFGAGNSAPSCWERDAITCNYIWKDAPREAATEDYFARANPLKYRLRDSCAAGAEYACRNNNCNALGFPGANWTINPNTCGCECPLTPKAGFTIDGDACEYVANPVPCTGTCPDKQRWSTDKCACECDPAYKCSDYFPGAFQKQNGWGNSYLVLKNPDTCECDCISPFPPGLSKCEKPGHWWKGDRNTCGCECSIELIDSPAKWNFNPSRKQCRTWTNGPKADWPNCNCGCETNNTGKKCPPGWTQWQTDTCSCCPWGQYKKCKDENKNLNWTDCNCYAGTLGSTWLN